MAIAAKFLADSGFKVLIVDWDAHHGDGTQKLLENNEKVFYFSTHGDTSLVKDEDETNPKGKYKDFYPGSNWGNVADTGGSNNVINYPVPVAKTIADFLKLSEIRAKAREEIMGAFKNMLVPAMDKFQPEFVLISCGFDAHEDDTLVALGLKTDDYRILTELVVGIANKYAKGRVVSVLEGGYSLKTIAEASVAHVKALMAE